MCLRSRWLQRERGRGCGGTSWFFPPSSPRPISLACTCSHLFLTKVWAVVCAMQNVDLYSETITYYSSISRQRACAHDPKSVEERKKEKERERKTHSDQFTTLIYLGFPPFFFFFHAPHAHAAHEAHAIVPATSCGPSGSAVRLCGGSSSFLDREGDESSRRGQGVARTTQHGCCCQAAGRDVVRSPPLDAPCRSVRVLSLGHDYCVWRAPVSVWCFFVIQQKPRSRSSALTALYTHITPRSRSCTTRRTLTSHRPTQRPTLSKCLLTLLPPRRLWRALCVVRSLAYSAFTNSPRLKPFPTPRLHVVPGGQGQGGWGQRELGSDTEGSTR